MRAADCAAAGGAVPARLIASGTAWRASGLLGRLLALLLQLTSPFAPAKLYTCHHLYPCLASLLPCPALPCPALPLVACSDRVHALDAPCVNLCASSGSRQVQQVRMGIVVSVAVGIGNVASRTLKQQRWGGTHQSCSRAEHR